MTPEEIEYRLVYHEKARVLTKAAIDQFAQAGWEKVKIDALIDAIEHRLKRAPLQFGEPHYFVPGTELQVLVGFQRPFAIEFAIHEESHVVLVRKLILMTTRKE